MMNAAMRPPNDIKLLQRSKCRKVRNEEGVFEKIVVEGILKFFLLGKYSLVDISNLVQQLKENKIHFVKKIQVSIPNNDFSLHMVKTHYF